MFHSTYVAYDNDFEKRMAWVAIGSYHNTHDLKNWSFLENNLDIS